MPSSPRFGSEKRERDSTPPKISPRRWLPTRPALHCRFRSAYESFFLSNPLLPNLQAHYTKGTPRGNPRSISAFPRDSLLVVGFLPLHDVLPVPVAQRKPRSVTVLVHYRSYPLGRLVSRMVSRSSHEPSLVRGTLPEARRPTLQDFLLSMESSLARRLRRGRIHVVPPHPLEGRSPRCRSRSSLATTFRYSFDSPNPSTKMFQFLGYSEATFPALPHVASSGARSPLPRRSSARPVRFRS